MKIKILQSKLNPHFLFNSLNVIQYYIGTNDKKAALRCVSRFSGFLRQVVESSDKILITVATEASLAEQYLWLEQTRFPGRFEYSVNIVDGAAITKTPPMLIHSILQKALYFNIPHSGKNTNFFLKLDFIKEDGFLIVRVCDNGIEKAEAKELQKTNGLDNGDNVLTQRLQAINCSAVKQVQLTFTRKNEENITELKIPQPLFNLN